MKNLFIDIETYSECDLKACGHYKYAEDETTEITIFAYSIDKEPVEIFDIRNAEELPPEIIEALTDPAVTKWAHNAAFEIVVISKCWNINLDARQWKCTAVWARLCGLPGDLKSLSEMLKMGEDSAKMKEGRRLILKFAKPGRGGKRAKEWENSKETDDWKLFKEYCGQDVRAEKAVARALMKMPVPEFEWEMWWLDQKINNVGLPIGMDMVENISQISETYREHLLKLISEKYGIDNPNSRDQMLRCLAKYDLILDDLQAETVKNILSKDGLDEDVVELLKARQQLSKSSIGKYDALLRAACDDNRLRGAFMFSGAERTGRWAGRIFQPQNLPRPLIDNEDIETARIVIKAMQGDSEAGVEIIDVLFGNVSGVLSSLIRSCITAEELMVFLVADYNSIESVMASWAVESEYLLDLFRNGRDPYKDFATKLYDIEYEDVTKKQRTICKPCVLGAQYGLGALGLMRYAEQFGIELSQEDAQKQINIFREAYSDIPAMWAKLKTAAEAAVRSSQDPKRPLFEAGRFTFQMNGKFLELGLPSGRKLFYLEPRVESGTYGNQLTYLHKSRKARAGTHPGKIFENIIQAISRDLLVCGLKAVDKAGFSICGHVHDEIICMEEDRGVIGNEERLEKMIKVMTVPPEWCADAPIRADGYAAEYYRKD